MDSNEHTGSVTRILGQFKDGDTEAAEAIVDRYFDRVVDRAAKRLADRGIRAVDGEDVALSVFESLLKQNADKKFADDDLADRQELWNLLCRLIQNKTVDAIRRETALKRGGGNVRGESVFMKPMDSSVGGIDRQAGESADAPNKAMASERFAMLMTILDNDRAREIVTLRLLGHEIDEIADRVQRSPRSVKRKLALARSIWLRLLDEDE
jgi:DNA-directed RNA polymerase specialized sigma24 family protein